jgi:hypothetical protein
MTSKLIRSQLGSQQYAQHNAGNFSMSRKLIQYQLGFTTIFATQRGKLQYIL